MSDRPRPVPITASLAHLIYIGYRTKTQYTTNTENFISEHNRTIKPICKSSLTSSVPQVLHSGHGVSSFSQSGCKLLFFTDYGMRHVITFLVCCFFAWAYLVLFHRFEPDNLDGKMRGNVAWLILLLLAIEGEAEICVDVFNIIAFIGFVMEDLFRITG